MATVQVRAHAQRSAGHARRWLTAVLSTALLATGLAAPGSAGASAAAPVWASARWDGGAANGSVGTPLALSRDGRHLAFWSRASNVVPGDTNGWDDVFVRDLLTGVTTQMSVRVDGGGIPWQSLHPAISGDGRYVAFPTSGDVGVPGESTYFDLFVRDRDADGNGTYDEPGPIAYTIASVKDDGTIPVGMDSAGNPYSSWHHANPAMSDDGRTIAFVSNAPFVAEDTNARYDVYVHDRDADRNGVFDEPGGITTRLASARADGVGVGDCATFWTPDVTPDGRFVAFTCEGNGLVSGDANNVSDVFVRDRDLDADGVFDEPEAVATVRVSIAQDGTDGEASSVFFGSRNPSITDDGRFVAFESYRNLAGSPNPTGDTDIFVRDRDRDENGTYDDAGGVETARVSVSSQGNNGDLWAYEPSISGDGRYVAYAAGSTNLVPDDVNGVDDVFVHDRHTYQVERVSVNADGAAGNNYSYSPQLSRDGSTVAFVSDASNFDAGDTNGTTDAYVVSLSQADTVAPSPIGADVDPVRSVSSLRLQYDEILDWNSMPSLAAFSVAVNGIQRNVVGLGMRVSDGTFIDVELASRVYAADTIVLSYTPTGAPIQDLAGNPVAAFASMPVQNRVTDAGPLAASGEAGAASTGTAPTAADPVGTTVQSPAGGTVTIVEQPAPDATPVYGFLGQRVVIEAEPSTPDAPIVLTFVLDASLLVDGDGPIDPSTVTVLRDGVPAGDCDGTTTPDGPVASPDPCVQVRSVDGSTGDLTLVVLTSHASTWDAVAVRPYAFTGFFGPLDRTVPNLARAGSAIPAIFSLGGDRGLDIFASGSPALAPVACPSGVTPDPVETTVSAGATSLSYDPGTDRYTLVVKTDKRWAGTCRELRLAFADGSDPVTAILQFRR